MNNSPYTFPARSRKDMISAILAQGGHDGCPIAFNVKMHSLDLDLDHILSLVEADYALFSTDAPEYPAYKALIVEKHTEELSSLYDWAVEDAQRSILEDDAYKMLYDGTSVDADLGIAGRSGGWILLQGFENLKLTDFGACNNEESRQYLRFELQELNFSALRLLYKYVEQCKVDFTPAKACSAVEYEAGFTLLSNLVEPAWEERQAEIIATEKAATETKETIDVLEGILNLLDALEDFDEDTASLQDTLGLPIDMELLHEQKLKLVEHITTLEKG